MKNQIGAFFLLGIIFMCSLQAQDFQLSPKVAVEVDKILEMSRYRNSRADRQGKTPYLNGLGTLTSQVNKETEEWALANEGRDLRAKVILLARDYRDRPQLYREIGDVYFKKDPSLYKNGIGPAVSSPPEVDPNVITGEYRLVFEGLLLAPPTPPEYEYAVDWAAMVIGKIGDERSLVLFEYLFSNKSYRVKNASVEAVLRMPSEKSLECLLRGLSGALNWERENNPKFNEEKDDVWEKVHLFYMVGNILKPSTWDKEADATYREWKDLIHRYPAENLDEQQRKIIKSLRANIVNK